MRYNKPHAQSIQVSFGYHPNPEPRGEKEQTIVNDVCHTLPASSMAVPGTQLNATQLPRSVSVKPKKRFSEFFDLNLPFDENPRTYRLDCRGKICEN